MPQTTTAPRKKTRLMTEGGIFKNLLLFAVPLILGNLLQQLYNTADSIIVGNFLGSNALAAVGSSGSPIFLLIGFSQGRGRGCRRRGGPVPGGPRIGRMPRLPCTPRWPLQPSWALC